MEKDSQNNYLIKFICPPTKIKYFYSFGFNCESLFVHKDQPTEQYPQKYINNIQCGSQIIEILEIKELNYIQVNCEERIVDDYYYSTIDSMPRVKLPEVQDQEIVSQAEQAEYHCNLKKQATFKFEFSDFLMENQEVLKKCLEFDWKQSKLPQLIENENDQAECIQILSKYYVQLKDAYKYISAIGISNQDIIICLTQANFIEFVNMCGILDDNFKENNLELKIKATKTNAIYNKILPQLNPNRSITRYQFLELLVRIADAKYIQFTQQQINDSDTGNSLKKQSISKAIKTLLKKNIIPTISQFPFNSIQWRETSFKNNDCLEVVKTYKKQLKKIFNMFANSKIKTFSQEKLLWLTEFRQIFQELRVISELNDRNINIIFVSSLLTQIDEMNLTKHLCMNFLEFIEGIARASELISFTNYNLQVLFFNYLNFFKKTYQIPLALKFESLIFQLNNFFTEKSNQKFKFEDSIFYTKSEQTLFFDDAPSLSVKELESQNKNINLPIKHFSRQIKQLQPEYKKGNLLREKINRSILHEYFLKGKENLNEEKNKNAIENKGKKFYQSQISQATNLQLLIPSKFNRKSIQK